MYVQNGNKNKHEITFFNVGPQTDNTERQTQTDKQTQKGTNRNKKEQTNRQTDRQIQK